MTVSKYNTLFDGSIINLSVLFCWFGFNNAWSVFVVNKSKKLFVNWSSVKSSVLENRGFVLEFLVVFGFADELGVSVLFSVDELLV